MVKIAARFQADPLRVVLVPEDVPNDVWAAVAVALSDDRARPGVPLTVEPVRLVQGRVALRGLLRHASVAFDPDPQVVALLASSLADVSALELALGRAASPRELSAEALLAELEGTHPRVY